MIPFLNQDLSSRILFQYEDIDEMIDNISKSAYVYPDGEPPRSSIQLENQILKDVSSLEKEKGGLAGKITLAICGSTAFVGLGKQRLRPQLAFHLLSVSGVIAAGLYYCPRIDFYSNRIKLNGLIYRHRLESKLKPLWVKELFPQLTPLSKNDLKSKEYEKHKFYEQSKKNKIQLYALHCVKDRFYMNFVDGFFGIKKPSVNKTIDSQ